jgi:PKD repeat protein
LVKKVKFALGLKTLTLTISKDILYSSVMKKQLLILLCCFAYISSNAQVWQNVGVGVSSTHGFTLWDGKLVVAGSFSSPCNRVAAWDGADYTCFGAGVGLVAREAAVYNGDLVVVGDFWNTHQPCVDCNGVARWDGSAWQPLGTGFNNDVLCATIWNGDLVVGGDFTEADGQPVSRIARWNGSAWVGIGGTNDFSYDIRGLGVYNGELWAGGDFIDVAGNSSYDRVVKWNGSAWIGGSQIGLPNGVSSTVRCFYVDQVQNKLYMGGHFLEVNGDTDASGVAVYDGSTWSSLGGGVNDYVRALTKYNGNIIVGGNFSTAGTTSANKIAKWNPVALTWTAMGSGMNDYVKALEVYNGDLYAGGPFTSASGQSINGVAMWNETASAAPVAGFTQTATSICPGQCVTFTNISTNSPTSYNWTFPGGSPSSSTSASPGSVCFNSAGTYSVKLKVCNATGCDSVTHSVTVGVPTISAGSNTTVCAGAGTTLSASGGSSYAWSPSTGLSCTSCSSPVATPSSTTTYTVTGTSSAGCTNTSTVTVSVSSLPIANAGSNAAICAGDQIGLSASGGSTYSWTPSSSLSCTNCANSVATPSSTTTYIVTATNANGCTDTDGVTITVNPLPVADAGIDAAICAGSSTVLSASGGNSYSWLPSTGLSCANCASPVAQPSSTITYTVTATGSNGCTATDQVNVVVSQLPNASAGNNTSVCAGQTVTLNATGGTQYSWDASSDLSCTSCQSPDATPAAAATYTVTVTDANGCTATSSVNVAVNALPSVSAGADASVCSGSFITLNATGALNYTWDASSSLSCTNCTSPDATPVIPTTYTVVGTDANGCSNSSTVTISVNSLPVAYAGSDDSICIGETAPLLATGGITYNWTPTAGLSCTSCPDPDAAPTSTTTYIVTVTDANGCSNTDDITLTVDLCTAVASISSQNAFTIYPNPAINGSFAIQSAIQFSYIEIYDNTGKIILARKLTSGDKLIYTDFASGIYLIKLVNDQTIVSGRITVQ